MNNAAIIAQTMNNAGFDVLPMEMDLSSRSSILSLIDEAQKHGEISMLVNVAGVSVKSRTCFPKNMYDFLRKHVRVFPKDDGDIQAIIILYNKPNNQLFFKV